MPSLLRTISKAKWEIVGLANGELQADALTDLNTRGNVLSLWHIEDDRSNVDRLITALAATRQKPDKFDYAIIDLDILSTIGIHIRASIGETPDEAVNSWHWDAIELTATQILKLAQAIRETGEIKRVLEKQITKMLIDAASSGRIQRARIKQEKMTVFLDAELATLSLDWPNK
jgi:hypothetical protein